MLAGLALVGGGVVAAAVVLLSIAAITFSPGMKNARASRLWKTYAVVVAALGLALLAWDKLLM